MKIKNLISFFITIVYTVYSLSFANIQTVSAAEMADAGKYILADYSDNPKVFITGNSGLDGVMTDGLSGVDWREYGYFNIKVKSSRNEQPINLIMYGTAAQLSGTYNKFVETLSTEYKTISLPIADIEKAISKSPDGKSMGCVRINVGGWQLSDYVNGETVTVSSMYLTKAKYGQEYNCVSTSILDETGHIEPDLGGNRTFEFIFETDLYNDDYYNAVELYVEENGELILSPTTFSVSTNGEKLLVTFDENLESPKKYVIKLLPDIIKSINGAVLKQEVSSSFYVGRGSNVFLAVGANPQNNASDVDTKDVNFKYEIIFNNPLSDDESIDYAVLIDFKKDGNSISSGYSVDVLDNVMTITFDEALEGDCEYTISGNKGNFADMYGNVLKEDFEYSFTAAPEPLVMPTDGIIFSADNRHDLLNFERNLAGTIVERTSDLHNYSARIDYEAGVNSTSVLTKKSGDITGYSHINFLVFNPNSSVEKINFLMYGGDGTPYYIYKCPMDWDGWKVVSLALADLEHTDEANAADIKNISINFNGWGNSRTQDGYILIDRVWLSNEKTENIIEVDCEYEDGSAYVETDLGGDGAFSFVFGKEIKETTSIEDSVVVEQYINEQFEEIEDFSVNVDGNKLNVILDNGAENGETYRISVINGGIYFEDYSVFMGNERCTFTVGSHTPFFNVVSVKPINGESIADTEISKYEIEFCTAVDSEQYLSDYISLYRNGEKLINSFEANIDEKKVILEFKEKLKANNGYKIKISPDLKDIYGNTLTGENTFEFYVEKETEGDVHVFSSMIDDDVNTAIAASAGMVSADTENANKYQRTTKISFTSGKAGDAIIAENIKGISDVKYINFYMYSPLATENIANLVFYSSVENNTYVRLDLPINWTGWKLISISMEKVSLAEIKRFKINFGGYSHPVKATGFLYVDDIWMSTEQKTAPRLLYSSMNNNYESAALSGEKITFNFDGNINDDNIQISVTEEGNEFTDYSYEANDDSLEVKFNELNPLNNYNVKIANLRCAKWNDLAVAPIDLSFKTVSQGVFAPKLNVVNASNSTSATIRLVNQTNTTPTVTMHLRLYNDNGNMIENTMQTVTLDVGADEEKNIVINSDKSYDYAVAYVVDEQNKLVSDRYVTYRNGTNSYNVSTIIAGVESIDIYKAETDVNQLTINGRIQGLSNIALVEISSGNNLITAVVSADYDGSFEYGYVFDNSISSGDYSVKVYNGTISDNIAVGYISFEDRNSLTLAVKSNDKSDVYEWLSLNASHIGLSNCSDEANEDKASVVLEDTYDSYINIINRFFETETVLNGLNAVLWSEMADYFENNEKVLFGPENKDYKYFENLSGRNKNAIISEYFSSYNYRTIGEFRKAFSDAISNQKNPSDKPSKNNSGGGGGASYPGKKEGSIITPGFSDVVQNSNAFSDIENYSWATESINKLYSMNILSMPGDKKFRPEDSVKREEFVKMIVVSFFETDVVENHMFNDEIPGEWYNKYLAKAYEIGVVTGYEDGRFGIGENITREQIATMLKRVFDIKGISVSNSSQIRFSDSSKISDYAKEAVSALTSEGIIKGMDDGSFAPEKNATRAEAAVLIARMINFLKGGNDL